VPVNSVRKPSFTKDSRPSGGGMLLGYARVSKGDEQNNSSRTKALNAADMARLYGVSQPTVSRIVAEHRILPA
jgi:hypothetical protein